MHVSVITLVFSIRGKFNTKVWYLFLSNWSSGMIYKDDSCKSFMSKDFSEGTNEQSGKESVV